MSLPLKAGFGLALFLLAGESSKGLAQSGAFTATGAMTVSRLGHTATLLPNGNVLLTGGVSGGVGGAVLASAELYDPSTRTFKATGSMRTARTGHTATLLADGRILIAGGSGSGLGSNGPGALSLASAELYDPSTGSFTATGNLLTAQFSHNATLLGNGKVLIARGLAVGLSPANAELYDPLSGTFAGAGPNAIPTFCDFCVTSAPLLPDGNVLVIGGSETQLYNPATGAFSAAGVALNCCHVTATVLTSGKVLLAGGEGDGVGRYSHAEVYDPATRLFTATGEMACGRGWHTSTLLPDGAVLIAGGESARCSAGSLQNVFGSTDGAELYDSSAGIFNAAGNLTTPREGHTATLLSDGTVLIAGGLSWRYPNPFEYPVTADLYTPAVLVPAPFLLSRSGDGLSEGAILHAGTHQPVSSGNPAVGGGTVEIYGIGLVNGGAIPPQVSIGGLPAEVLFFGKAPGFMGLDQVNVRVPSGVAPGAAVPVRLTYLDRPSNKVTIAVR